MKVKVDQNLCIGCGACAAICPNVFALNDEGKSEVINASVSEEEKENVIDAKESCPVAAIEAE